MIAITKAIHTLTICMVATAQPAIAQLPIKQDTVQYTATTKLLKELLPTAISILTPTTTIKQLKAALPKLIEEKTGTNQEFLYRYATPAVPTVNYLFTGSKANLVIALTKLTTTAQDHNKILPNIGAQSCTYNGLAYWLLATADGYKCTIITNKLGSTYITSIAIHHKQWAHIVSK